MIGTRPTLRMLVNTIVASCSEFSVEFWIYDEENEASKPSLWPNPLQ